MFMADKAHLRLVPSGSDLIDEEVSKLPYFALPREMDKESMKKYAELVLANCNYVVEHGEQMSEEQCYEILKKFDKKFLQVRKTNEGILVWDPRNLEHHNQSVRKRLVDLCTHLRERFAAAVADKSEPIPKKEPNQG